MIEPNFLNILIGGESCNIFKAFADFEANGIEFSEFSEEQELNITFDNSGNLVLTQVVETIIEEQGLELSATVDARAVFSPN